MGLLKGNLFQRLILGMERSLLRRFDSVSSISGRMVERLLQKGVSQERISYFPNWVDISRFKPTSTSGTYRARLGIAADAVVVLFSGTLGGKQGLTAIPAAAKLLAARKDILFVICGDGMMKPELEAATADLPNVRLFPLQPAERLGELLCMADMHLLPQNLGAADLVLPSKLSGMLASGRPVIATCHAGTELEAVVSQCGIVVPPEDNAELAAAVCRLADDAAMRVELGRRARIYAEAHFEREAILGKVFGPIEGDEAEIPDDVIA
jgi:colanic acid biosynthesis glycosyl transferase WcaI